MPGKFIPIRFVLFALALTNISNFYGQQPDIRKITLAWDTSLSMEKNDTKYIFKYLDSVFKSSSNFEVRLIPFNTDATAESFLVQSSNWTGLKNRLNGLTYDGAASFDVLSGLLNATETYIYTDGKQVLAKERVPIEKGHTLLSRASGEEKKQLERTALLYRGKYIQLTPAKSENAMQGDPAAEDLIRGRIFVDNKPAQGLLVQVKGDSKGSYTDISGRFSLKANSRDSLLISGGGFTMPLLRTLPSDAEPTLFLDSRVIALEEVELVQRQRREEQVSGINIGYGETDKDRVGVAVQSIGDDRISSVTTDVSKSIQGKFSGVQLGQEDDISKVTMRTSNTMLLNNYGLIVVDGVPMQQGDSSGRNPQPAFNFVDPENIADVTVLKGMAATTRYGTLGANGVILITTKNAVYGGPQKSTVDRAQLKNNTYTGGALSENTNSLIIETLEHGSLKDAYNRYLNLRRDNLNQLEFYLQAFTFFKKHNPNLAAKVLTNLIELHPKNIGMFNAVLLGLAELNLKELGSAVAESASELSLNSASPLLYLGSVTEDKRVLNDLIRKLILLKNGLDKSSAFQNEYGEFLEKEIKHLIYVRRFDVDKNQYPEKYHSVPTYKARLVFEWNLHGAEFAIQSVNPTQKYYTWEHSNAADSDLIREEIQSGITFKDFELVGDESNGEWLFNVEFLDFGPDGSQYPFLISCRLYENFGTPQETSRTLTLSFSKPLEKKTMLTFSLR